MDGDGRVVPMDVSLIRNELGEILRTLELTGLTSVDSSQLAYGSRSEFRKAAATAAPGVARPGQC